MDGKGGQAGRHEFAPKNGVFQSAFTYEIQVLEKLGLVVEDLK